jgi:cobalt-zinc-cadmium efflux system protein
LEHQHHPKIFETEERNVHHDLAELPYSHRPEAQKKLFLAMLLTGSMMVVEGVGGFLTGSLALLSDAGHMLSHFLALGTSFIAILVAAKKVSNRFSFGLYRIEVLAALFNGATLLLIVAYILYESYKRFLNPQPIATVSMFWIALAGLVVNLLTALILHNAGKGDINVRGAFLHMLADTASSFGVVGGAIVIYFTSWLWVDPALSMLIALMIAIWSWGLLKDSVLVLLESTPHDIRLEEVVSVLRKNFNEILDVHDLHVWEVTSHMYSLAAHISVDRMLTVSHCEKLRDQINYLLDHHFHITHTNLQFEGGK